MKKTTQLQLLCIVILGLLPLLWFRQDTIMANSDNFPLFLNPQKILSSGTQLWTLDAMGHADSMPSYALYQYSAVLLGSVGLSTGVIQILFQILLFMGAGLSMYYFSKNVYPDLKISPLIASLFYMFNFFVLQSRLNLGFAWVYTFLPLMAALLIKIINAAYSQNDKGVNKNIIYFAIVSTITLSVASINPSNIFLVLIGLSILFFYYFLKYLRYVRPLLIVIVKLALVIIPLSLWWLLPMLNNYLFSSQILNEYVDISTWTWTHNRASFLNLFWLNGVWNWSPEYYPYINSYSNPVLIVLVFLPFIIASSALVFKSKKSRFNAYLMLAILFFIFLAKGVHEPVGQLNFALYEFPFMDMFREPSSKFTMIMLPFLALLIGFSVEKISNLKIFKYKVKKFAPLVFVAVFVVAAYPLVVNPIETRTDRLPFSSYVQVPAYWFQATDWLNGQNGDFKVLLMPLDDFYQMPYSWGYYGTDQLIDTLIEKPIISTNYLDGYKVNPDTAKVLEKMYSSMVNNNVTDFKACLDLFNVRYILQRDDVLWYFIGRDIFSTIQMELFLNQQSYIQPVIKFGELKIYEYKDYKPMLYVVSPNVLSHKSSQFSITDVESVFDDNAGNKLAAIADYRFASNTRIEATVNVNQPCILAISQTLDDSWVAYVNGERIQPVPLYFGIKGFQLNQTGQCNIVIEYEPQVLLNYLSVISIIALVLCIAYLVMPASGKTRIAQKIVRRPLKA